MAGDVVYARWLREATCEIDKANARIAELEAEVAELSGALALAQEVTEVCVASENALKADKERHLAEIERLHERYCILLGDNYALASEVARLRAQLDYELEWGYRRAIKDWCGCAPTSLAVDTALEQRRKERG